jgi:hypothetical protein
MEGLRKTTNNHSQQSRSPGRDFNSDPHEYEAGVLTTRPRCYFLLLLTESIKRRGITLHTVFSKEAYTLFRKTLQIKT